ncbi:benenodin family lasso peptide [Sphingomonas sp. G-3-2-10]|jgi:hypothetical protein|nr:benenodin family lasso peptide [Sphingomonas sp. G-3-2-10]NML08059.1 benenodin family lasso peptide [Sphingomonas sp. G-3-2-10]
MHREEDQSADLIDLGAASVQTQGYCTGIFEFIGYMLPQGVSED